MALRTAVLEPSSAFFVSKKGPRETFTSSSASVISNVNTLLAPLTRTEVGACWELCRLQNGMGCATVLLPVAWSLAMVYHAYPQLTGLECLNRAAVYFFLCIGIKCLIMTIDDILDYDIDAKVERTKNRPLPRGAISIERAWLFFALQAVIGVFLAYKVLSPDARRISMYVWPLYVLYPTCKRWMYFAPIPLGLMFNIGIYMGWADLTPDGRIPYYSLTAAYFGATMWTITYETVYQHQDKVDDVKIGMKSLAILCGKYTILICSATTFGFATLMTLAGYLNGQGIAYYIAIAMSAFVILKELAVTDIDEPRECMKFFLRTPAIGNLILAGLVIDVGVQRVLAGISL
ncbi:UbiA prenyltransferase family-domain-containing protein [Desarmillaria tabescens]|uniref:UbiA prenyltransferase family-domain-containing protein n=1 Tax=Armillaria tabescens TaxID=1929756 RepID=A0AA39JEW1_ARMTA|nr:UbiA prenyltransferase family-domain-containing protein [Desarmillaria tabescens]KAK0440049.1 UbiA prenyltransferase family-domain-containing protein [Desarmillaria tabescens]